MVQTLDNVGVNGEELPMKNTSSSSSTSTVAVGVSESVMMLDNDNCHHQTDVILSTTENSKFQSANTSSREFSTLNQHEYHERAMSIVNELIREGKLSNSYTCTTHAVDSMKDDNDHNCKTLAELMNETVNISPSFLLVVAFKTVRLLDLLHKHHLVHRNLTLENITVEQLQDGNLNVHFNNLDKSIELFLIDNSVVNTHQDGEEHAGRKSIPHKCFNYNRNLETSNDYQPPETSAENPFICLKSEIWSLAVCILRVLFRKKIDIHPEGYVEQLDELFGKDVEDNLTQDENSTVMTCFKEMTRNMLRSNVNERWSCADVSEYICLASTFLTSFTQEFLNQ